MKKLTKLTALALALALSLSLVTVSAAPEVFFHEDFSSYADTAAFDAVVKKNKSATFPTLVAAGTGKYYQHSNAWLNSAYCEFVTNQAGHKAYMPWTGDGGNNYTIAYVFPEAWNLNASENAGKTMVFAYDYEHTMSQTAGNNNLAKANANRNADRLVYLWWSGETADNSDKMNINAISTADENGNRTLTSYYIGYANGNSPASGLGNETLTASPETTYRVAVGITAHETAVFQRTWGVNGVGSLTNGFKHVTTGAEAAISGGEHTYLRGFGMNSRSDTNVRYGNIMFYVIDTDSFAVSTPKTTNVGIADDIVLNFANPVSEAAFKANKGDIVVKANGAPLAEGAYTVSDPVNEVNGQTIDSYATISFTEDLDFGTTYTVEFPAAITNEIAQPLNNSTVSFTTEAAPAFTMTLNAYKGLREGTAATELEGTVYFKATAEQLAGAKLNNGTVAIAICDSEGNVVKYATSKKAFGESPVEFGASFKLEAGQKAKAFVVGAEGEAVVD